MSARGYALHSVYSQLAFPFFPLTPFFRSCIFTEKKRSVSTVDSGDTEITQSPSLGTMGVKSKHRDVMIMPSSMWTRRDRDEFRDRCKAMGDSVIKISSLSTTTVSFSQSAA